MSYSPSIYKFADGGEMPVPLDMELVRAVLEPHDVGNPQLTVGEDGGLQFLIRASDGSEAEISADETGILVERPHTGGVFGIVAELVSRLGAVIIDPSRGRAVCREEEYAHLPAGMQEDAVVIEMTGEAVEAALIGTPRR
ncbi:hypothetical protein O3Q52_23660 [Streptomyces sp. ActVer]|uniref:hypothetical protein n=1 Tax=Streptomyces sp. ActVer TaxID=3014558 RepID=UPI0022B3B62C|nr:hypothetical protein [Streptomyces sp. ActVer]MCZ4511128.1 hypothetical protein [Streptomyces sp. ActVer]